MSDTIQTSAPPSRKLHLGCGKHSLAGWLNTDMNECPASSIIKLDATKPFPFEPGSFAYVFSEHMIEHIPFKDGTSMLKECFRVLQPGGKIRIATPDFRFLVNLYVGS